MKKYVCEVSKAGTFTKSGSWLIPTLYGQMEAAANVSYVLYCYDKFSTNLQTCRFVMVAFRDISRGVSWFGKAQQLDLQLGWQWCLQLLRSSGLSTGGNESNVFTSKTAS